MKIFHQVSSKRKHQITDDGGELSTAQLSKRTRKNGADAIVEPILLDLSFENESDTVQSNLDDNDKEIEAGIKYLFDQHEIENITTDKIPK